MTTASISGSSGAGKPACSTPKPRCWKPSRPRAVFLPLHDRSDPAEIQRRLGMSKKAFKKGVGTLYKARTILLRDGGIALATDTDPDA